MLASGSAAACPTGIQSSQAPSRDREHRGPAEQDGLALLAPIELALREDEPGDHAVEIAGLEADPVGDEDARDRDHECGRQHTDEARSASRVEYMPTVSSNTSVDTMIAMNRPITSARDAVRAEVRVEESVDERGEGREPEEHGERRQRAEAVPAEGVLPSELFVEPPRISSWFSSAVLLKSSDGNADPADAASNANNRLRPTTLAEKSISPKSSTEVGKDER